MVEWAHQKILGVIWLFKKNVILLRPENYVIKELTLQ